MQSNEETDQTLRRKPDCLRLPFLRLESSLILNSDESEPKDADVNT